MIWKESFENGWFKTNKRVLQHPLLRNILLFEPIKIGESHPYVVSLYHYCRAAGGDHEH